MKFTVQKANLLPAMEIANGAIPSNSTQPILYSFKIKVSGMAGEIMANDLVIGIRSKFACMAEEDGEICVNAKTLLMAVKKMGKDDITFETDGTQVIVTGGKARYEFSLEDKDLFIEPREIEDSVQFKVDAETFTGMINGVAFACGMNQNNKVLRGINLMVKDGSMTLSALDLIQVAIRQTDIKADDANVIIPQKPMLELAKSATGGEIEITVCKNHVVFSFTDTKMIIRLIDGNFFNIKQIMTDDFKVSVNVERSELMACLDRSLVVMKGDNTPMIFDISDGLNVSLKSNTSTFDEDVDCSVDGDKLRIGINPQRLLEIFKHISDDEITLNFSGEKAPVTIKNNDLGYRYILLPVNI